MESHNNRIEFKGAFGDHDAIVVIEQLKYGPTNWNVYVDNKLIAEIFERYNGYHYHGKTLTADDVQSIVDRITDFKGEPHQRPHFSIFKCDM